MFTSSISLSLSYVTSLIEVVDLEYSGSELIYSIHLDDTVSVSVRHESEVVLSLRVFFEASVFFNCALISRKINCFINTVRLNYIF